MGIPPAVYTGIVSKRGGGLWKYVFSDVFGKSRGKDCPPAEKIRSQGRRYSPLSRFGSEQPDEKGFLLKGVSCILVYEKQPEGGAL